MNLSDFRFELPPRLIAQRPSLRREDARLLVVDRASGGLSDTSIRTLVDYLDPKDLLVRNNSRVFPARTATQFPSGALGEALFIRPVSAAGSDWVVLIRPSKKVRQGGAITFPEINLDGVAVKRGGEGEWVIRFPEGTGVLDTLHANGRIPLPPYIKREPDEEDRRRYQTVYASPDGSVAAPTAGLHFTDDLLDQLQAKGIEIASITLHVGPGTFRPIRVDSIEDHEIEPEAYEISVPAATSIAGVKSRAGRLIAVGTTTVRTLEGGVGSEGVVSPGRGFTDCYIYPPYSPRLVDGMLTNFHLPGSSLFVLVCGMAGTDLMQKAYRYAIDRDYRFYSYGDAMLIL